MPDNTAANESSEYEEEATRRIGHMLAGKYRLDSVIGSGGMAHVFRATNTVIGRVVAIKVLRGEYARNPETVERFLREARTANIVRHPNVIDVIDFGVDNDGASFIVQELLQGETLFAYANRRQGVVPLTELGEIMSAVLSAVGDAHAAGVIHRDLKPENIFLCSQRGQRVVKVLDFGISKVLGTDMTAAGMMLGTPAYMAPELARSSKTADPRSDVWAVGVMLFELLTGRVPFEGDSVGALFAAIMSVDPVRLSDVRTDLPVALSGVIERCLRRDPGERYPNAHALATDLAAAIGAAKPATPVGWSLPPSGHDATMVGIGGSTGGPSLVSRLASRSVSRVSASPPNLQGAGIGRSTPGGGAVSSRQSGSRPGSGSGPGRVTPQQRPGMKTNNKRRSRHTPATRKSQVRRGLAWTDILGVLGVGVLLALAILAVFRLTR